MVPIFKNNKHFNYITLHASSAAHSVIWLNSNPEPHVVFSYKYISSVAQSIDDLRIFFLLLKFVKTSEYNKKYKYYFHLTDSL